jgi:hypothetical protein
VRVKEPLGGEKLIKELSNVIRKRFAHKIAALQELKRGVEEDYSRNYGNTFRISHYTHSPNYEVFIN